MIPHDKYYCGKFITCWSFVNLSIVKYQQDGSTYTVCTLAVPVMLLVTTKPKEEIFHSFITVQRLIFGKVNQLRYATM